MVAAWKKSGIGFDIRQEKKVNFQGDGLKLVGGKYRVEMTPYAFAKEAVLLNAANMQDTTIFRESKDAREEILLTGSARLEIVKQEQGNPKPNQSPFTLASVTNGSGAVPGFATSQAQAKEKITGLEQSLEDAVKSQPQLTFSDPVEKKLFTSKNSDGTRYYQNYVFADKVLKSSAGLGTPWEIAKNQAAKAMIGESDPRMAVRNFAQAVAKVKAQNGPQALKKAHGGVMPPDKLFPDQRADFNTLSMMLGALGNGSMEEQKMFAAAARRVNAKVASFENNKSQFSHAVKTAEDNLKKVGMTTGQIKALHGDIEDRLAQADAGQDPFSAPATGGGVRTIVDTAPAPDASGQKPSASPSFRSVPITPAKPAAAPPMPKDTDMLGALREFRAANGAGLGVVLTDMDAVPSTEGAGLHAKAKAAAPRKAAADFRAA